MRRIRYSVAMSLDGYIAGPSGEIDWITMDPEIDFSALFAQFDTVFMGRRTFEAMARMDGASTPGMSTFVFSRTLSPSDHPEVTIVASDVAATIASIRAKPGKDIWLMGGGSLFQNLSEEGLVDGVEVTIVPVLLGSGVPLVPESSSRIKLELTSHRIYQSGLVSLEYRVS